MLCGKGSLISLILPVFKTKALANSLRGLAYKIAAAVASAQTANETAQAQAATAEATAKAAIEAAEAKTTMTGQALDKMKTKQSKTRRIMSRRRGRAPRVKLRRRNLCCSPLTPLLQLWEPFLLRTGAGLGRLAGRSC